MYKYKMFQSGNEVIDYVNNYGGVGVGLTQAKIISIGFDPGNGRYFIFHAA